jgi:hypothetical protein
MSLLNPPAYTSGVVNDRNNIESGIKHKPLEPPWQQQRCGKWLNIESGITHECSECPDYSTRVVKDWNIIESGNKNEHPEHPTYSTCAVND